MFLKTTTRDGKEVIFNLRNVTHFYPLSELETNVCLAAGEDFVTIPYSIKRIEEGICNFTKDQFFITL